MQQRKADVLPRVGHEALAVFPSCRGTFGLFMSARQTRLCLSDSNRGEMRSHFSRTFKVHYYYYYWEASPRWAGAS